MKPHGFWFNSPGVFGRFRSFIAGYFRKLAIIALVLGGGRSELSAATYYIDYSAGADTNDGTSKSTPFKNCPGMATFSGSYSNSAGDTFVFRGGVTWPASTLPLTVRSSGTPGNIASYTVDMTWFSGGSWSQPVFDGGMTLGPNASGIYANGKSYILIDNLKILNVGNDASGSGTCVSIFDGNHVEVKNCWLQPEGIQAFAYDNSVGAKTGVYFHHNHISRAGRAVVYSDLGTTVSDVRIYNNVFEGSGNTQLRSYHLDGFMLGMPTPTCGGSAAAVINVLFYNNYFYGDWSSGATAQLYSNGWVDRIKIYNNVFAFENTSAPIGNEPILSPGFVDFGCHDSNIEIYNNTFANDALHGFDSGTNRALGAKAGIIISGSVSGTPIKIKGNIFSNLQIDVLIDVASGLVMDYNLHNPDTTQYGDLLFLGTAQYKSLSAVRAAGFELNAPAVVDPKFVTIPTGTFVLGSGNWKLQASSPAIDRFPSTSAPTNVFTDDFPGWARGPSWDMGAYEYVGPPRAPTGMKIASPH